MRLQFLGRGAGFSNDHTSAYFLTRDKDFVLFDCPASAFEKLKKIDYSKYGKIFVLITHTHGDHVGGLGLFAQYAYFVLKKTITIVAPSDDVKSDLLTLLTIEGNDPSWYKLVHADYLKYTYWFGHPILTHHSPQLEGKCFGYHVLVDDVDVIYSGDTSVIKPYMPCLCNCASFYVDVSVHYGMIHLKLEDVLDDLIALTKVGISVYLMHLDDVEAAEKIISGISGIKIVTVK